MATWIVFSDACNNFILKPCGIPAAARHQQKVSSRLPVHLPDPIVIINRILIKLTENEVLSRLTQEYFMLYRMTNFSKEDLDNLMALRHSEVLDTPENLTAEKITRLHSTPLVAVHTKAFNIFSKMLIFLDKAKADELQQTGHSHIFNKYAILVGNITSTLCDMHMFITKNHNSFISIPKYYLYHSILNTTTEADRRYRDYILLNKTNIIAKKVKNIYQEIKKRHVRRLLKSIASRPCNNEDITVTST